MKEFNSQKLKVKIDGAEYDLRKCSVAQAEKIIEDLEKVKEDQAKAYKLQKQFVCELGLPMEVIDQMDADVFEELSQYLFGSKKNA